jgi:hypothetical protein
MKRILALVCGCLAVVGGVQSYPIDGYDHTEIRRVLYTWRVYTGEVPGRALPPGAKQRLASVVPAYIDGGAPPFSLEPDPGFSAEITKVLGEEGPEYAVSVMDLSDPANPTYAEHNGDIRRNVGSVGKLVIGVAWFQALADVYPDDIEARERLLRETVITGDEFIISDHHKVLFFDPETNAREWRKIQVGDTGTIWEWLDWMLSASNNSAASTMQKHTMLLAHFGKDYPPTPEQEAQFWADHDYNERGEIFLRLMNEGLSKNGIDVNLLRQGSFFTREGKKRVGGTNSYGNVRELVRYLYLLERGELVDAWSSTELKRLLYMTQRRIRYASHPVLNPYAVYFKSGSLYSCQPEEGFTCKQYQGNKLNLLASVAIVEGPVPDEDYHYLVAVSSNVLKKNSAVAHQTLALRIHRMIEARHAERLAAEKAAAAEAAAAEAAAAGAAETETPAAPVSLEATTPGD